MSKPVGKITEEEITRMQELFQSYSIKEVAKVVHRSETTVRRIVYAQKLRPPREEDPHLFNVDKYFKNALI